ncbi:MAG: CpsB/CapC family capsule biosynthesis tyrosine phosphatase [Desulfobacterales bacterium]
MIDLHCHLLPGLDDGPENIVESLAMARRAIEDGIHTIIATPHGLGSSFANMPDTIERAVSEFRRIIEIETIPLILYAGMEIHICPELAKRIINGEAVFLDENRRYALIEFPFQQVPFGFKEELFHLLINGVTPVIAHPERNPMVHMHNDILIELIKTGCLIQVNSTSITGGFGDDVMKCVHDLLNKRLVHIIASDAHSAYGRPPVLSRAIEIAGKILRNREEADRMVNAVPRAVLNGEPVDISEPATSHRKW